jgi:LCP family protein required for cell wall assembly
MSHYDVDDAGGQAPRRATRGGSPSRRRRRIAAWTSVCLTAVLVAVALGAYGEYRNVVDSIHHVAITGLGKRPPQYTNAVNILMIGSDSRNGANKRFGESLAGGPQRSDTVIVLHISPGRHRATVLSFPRDSMVPTYACTRISNSEPGQVEDLTSFERINSTFANGGPACLWKTIEQQTGIRIDHFIELNFTGFIHVINDIGGVNLCLPFAVNNVNSGLHLSAGEHHVKGTEALAFWRTRENIGMGSDLQRIQRDQYLMASLMQGIEHSNMLASPTRIFSVVKDVADAMTTDMYPSTLLKIAESMKDVSLSSVQFIEIPTAPYVGDPLAEVQFAEPGATRLFTAIAHDRTLPKTKKVTSPKVTPVLDANPSKVNVQVMNGSGVEGIAGTAGAALTARGFHVVGTGDDPPFDHTSSVIEYASAADMPAVKTLQQQLSDVTVQLDTSLTPGTIELVLGSSYQGLLASPSTATAHHHKPGVDSLAKSFGGITAAASCRSDGAAFAGPDSP